MKINQRLVRAVSTVLAGVLVALNGCGNPRPDPGRAERLGRQYYGEGRYMDAIAMFETVREFNREAPEPALYIGRCYMALSEEQFRQDNLIGAIRYCDRAILAFTMAHEAFPGFYQAIEAKAEALKRKGQHESALALAEWAAQACGPRAKFLILQAREYADRGEADEAVAILRKAAEVEPNNAAPHAELGRMYARFGKRSEAIQALQRAYELNPDAPGVEATLAALQSQR